METHRRPTVTFDVERMARDIAERGWLATDLARVAQVSERTVSRFLRRESQTAKTAKKLAEAMGYSVKRYMGSARQAVA